MHKEILFDKKPNLPECREKYNRIETSVALHVQNHCQPPKGSGVRNMEVEYIHGAHRRAWHEDLLVSRTLLKGVFSLQWLNKNGERTHCLIKNLLRHQLVLQSSFQGEEKETLQNKHIEVGIDSL